MIEYKKKECVISTNVAVSMVCNCCGKVSEIHDDFDDTDITDITISFSYGSRFDLEKWVMDICDDCLTKWASSFKYAAQVLK